MHSTDRIPFSWALLLLALLHFSVFSIGVCESHSRDFFLRHNSDLNTCYSPRSQIEPERPVKQIDETLLLQQQTAASFAHEQEHLAQSSLDKQSLVIRPISSPKVLILLAFSVLSNVQEAPTPAAASALSSSVLQSFPFALAK